MEAGYCFARWTTADAVGALASCFTGYCDPKLIEHSLETLETSAAHPGIAQRRACPYVDLVHVIVNRLRRLPFAPRTKGRGGRPRNTQPASNGMSRDTPYFRRRRATNAAIPRPSRLMVAGSGITVPVLVLVTSPSKTAKAECLTDSQLVPLQSIS